MSPIDHSPSLRRARRRVLTIVATLGATAGLVALSPQPAQVAGTDRVTICHEVGNGSYRVIEVAVSTLVSGHGHHTSDILPAANFTHGRETVHFPGRNLGPIGPDGQTGLAILRNGCSIPAPATTQAPTTAAPALPAATTTLAPSLAGPTTTAAPAPGSTAVPDTAATTTLAPDPTTTATPTPDTTAVPDTAATTTLAPRQAPTPTAATTVAPGLVPTPDPTLAPGLTPTPVPTLSPALVPATLPGQIVPPLAPETQLVPHADCVDRRADGVSVVWFDYLLAGDQPIRVEWGDDNELSPNGLPPQLFGPGIHVRMVSVETTDGVASWTLAGTTATSGPDTPACDALPETWTPSATTVPVPTPATTAVPDLAPTTTEPGTTEPGTTEPSGTTPDGCAPGEALVDDRCTPVAPIQLSLIDNVVDCSGFGIATFAALNENEFELTDDDIVSELSPPRHDGLQPTRISAERIVTPDGVEVSETFQVTYVTSVTWSVTHHGVTASASAGANGARADDDCPLAPLEMTGLPGTLTSTGTPQLATAGTSTSGPISLVAITFLLGGVALVGITRRRPEPDPID